MHPHYTHILAQERIREWQQHAARVRQARQARRTRRGWRAWTPANVGLPLRPIPPAQPGTGTPQDTDEDVTSDLALTRATIQLRRQAIVTSVMDLTSAESQAFWPLYREYRIAMAKVGDRVQQLLVDYSGQYDTLTDDQAKKIMQEWLSIEKAKIDVKSKYISRFQKILPARKVMRFFQADNKLDAMLNAQLASVVPLAR